jgi:eukaryotic-like serine/threonine-protein kinase
VGIVTRKFWGRLGLLALFFAAASVSAAFTVNFLVKSGDDVEVPALTGKTTQEAEQVLSPHRLLLDIQGTQFDEKFPEGVVLYQSVPAGAMVRSGRKIGVVLSKGERERVVPRIAGLDRESAKLVLASSELDLAVSTTSCDDDTPVNRIIAQDPPPGTAMAGRELRAVVSSGSCNRKFVMPEVRGQPASEFLSDLERKGFVVRFFQYEERDDMPAGTLISASPAAGTIVENANPVTLIVSKEPPKIVLPEDETPESSRWVYMTARGPDGLFGKPAKISLRRSDSGEPDQIDFFLAPGENAQYVVWMPYKSEAVFSLDDEIIWRKEY